MNTATNKTVFIIGGGNMGGSLAKGLLANKWRAEQINICEQNLARHDLLRSEFPHCKIIQFCPAPIPSSCIIILAVKPQDIRSVCKQIASDKFASDTLFISIAAGVPTDAMQQWLGEQAIIVRCMPNTPAAIGHGITGLYTSVHTDEVSKKCAQEILDGVGTSLWVQEESILDAVTALSGSGPAYLFYFMQCLQKSGQALGLSEQDSYDLTLQTIAGASRLAQQQNKNFAELRANVTSKGGTTEQAINCLSKHKFNEIVNEAVSAAANRATEISKSFSKD